MNNKFWNQKGIVKTIGADAEGKNGRDITFYTLPIGILMRLKNTCKEAAPFIASCFTDTSKDVDTDTTKGVDEKGGGVYEASNTVVKAISPSMASLRLQQREKGIASLIETLFSDQTKDLLADIIIASAPDTFKAEDKPDLLDNTPLHIFIEMGSAIMEVNKGAFAGLGEHLPRLLKNNQNIVDGATAVRQNLDSVISGVKPPQQV